MIDHQPTVTSLTTVFDDFTDSLNTARAEDHFGYYHPDAVILDEDFPWNLTTAEFADHLLFHVLGGGDRGLWEFFRWIPRDLKFTVVGTTGQVSGFSTMRGKVRDAGFRLRYMGFTQNWAFHHDRWQMLSWHQSVLAGRIEGASPA